MDREDSRKKQFQDALKLIEQKQKDSIVQVKDVEFILSTGFKLSMEFDRVEKSRAKWRARAETAEAKLK